MSPFDRSDLHDLIREQIRRAGPFASIEELNQRLAAVSEDYNNRPQADLGGLSPRQMAELFSGDWKNTGALRLDSTLSMQDLSASPLLVDARALLQFVVDNGPVKLTPAGNLPRNAVQMLLPLRTDALLDYQRPATPNEGDVLWLVVLRHALQVAKLLDRRRGLIISKSGRRLLEERHAGELFALLFQTIFRTLNLAFFDNSDRHPGLQATIVFSFYRLRTMASDWTSPQALADGAWHPDAKDPPLPSELEYSDLRHWPFTHRVLQPLVQFGLMERRVVDPDARWKEHEYRVSPLYSRFLRFKPDGA